MELGCVENITVDTTTCVKECEGLMITGYTFDYFYYGDLNYVIPKLWDDYGKYKKITIAPPNNKGNHNNRKIYYLNIFWFRFTMEQQAKAC